MKKSELNMLVRNEILEALDLCLKNYWQYNHKFYSQNFGLAMRDLQSPLLADFFMSHIEQEIMNSNQSNDHIHCLVQICG